MQFSCNEKPTLCIKACPKSQANYDTLTYRFMHIKCYCILTFEIVCSVIITQEKYSDN